MRRGVTTLVASDYLKEERRLTLEVFGYPVNLDPIFGGESEVVTPLQERGEGVAELKYLFQAVRDLTEQGQRIVKHKANKTVHWL